MAYLNNKDGIDLNKVRLREAVPPLRSDLSQGVPAIVRDSDKEAIDWDLFQIGLDSPGVRNGVPVKVGTQRNPSGRETEQCNFMVHRQEAEKPDVGSGVLQCPVRVDRVRLRAVT